MIGSLYRFWLAHGPRPAGIRRAELLDMLRPEAGERLLEVGPGAGYYSLPVARSLEPGGRLALVDVDQAMLEATVRRLLSGGVGGVIQARRSDGSSLPFDDGSFDRAFLVAVLGEIHDRAAALRELRRVLRRGGRLVVGETTLLDPHALSPARLRAEAEAAGFRLDQQTGGRSYLARFSPA
jgi:ubiquinone/menaquinone biosynthesis C-methylase UbiE